MVEDRRDNNDLLRSIEVWDRLVAAMFQQSQVRRAVELETSQLKHELEYEPLFGVRQLLHRTWRQVGR